MIALIGRVHRRLRPDRPNPYGIPSDTPNDLRDQFDIDMRMALPGSRGPEVPLSTSLVLFRRRPWWAPSRSADLDRRTVDHALGRLLDRLDEIDQAPGDVLEVAWHGQRVGSQWTISFGERGVRRVMVAVWDDDLGAAPDAYRDELRNVVGPLRELAVSTRARLLVGGEDLTGDTVDDIIDVLA